MNYNLIVLFILITSSYVFTQVDNSITPINNKFEISLDSIEGKVTSFRWGKDSSYYLHYTITNISKDTLTYVTNSCFYYDHYSLKIGENLFDLNSTGGCYMNATTPYSLAPGASFHKSEWITAANLNTLIEGEYVVSLWIPLIKDDEKTYRVDGRIFVKNAEYLIFEKPTKIIKTNINYKKRSKNNIITE